MSNIWGAVQLAAYAPNVKYAHFVTVSQNRHIFLMFADLLSAKGVWETMAIPFILLLLLFPYFPTILSP